MATDTLDLVRIVDGKQVPAAGTWAIDPTHTQAEFIARHLMVTKVRGGFEVSSGSIVVADDPAESTVEVVLDASSVSSGTADRDAHITSPDFLDVENYGDITFRSTSVDASGSAWKLTGDLTIKDVTRQVVLDFARDFERK